MPKPIKWRYFHSSSKEEKHEISRQEFIRVLGNSNHCVKTIYTIPGLGDVTMADLEKAERLLRSAQRRDTGSIWLCGKESLYLEFDRDYIANRRRMRDSRYPDQVCR